MPQTDRPARFSPGLSQADLAAGYEKIGSRVPFTKSDVEKAYQPYGLRLDKSRKTATDSALQHTAAKAVVNWFLKDKANKAAAQKPSPTPAPRASAPVAATGASAPRASTPSSSSGRRVFDDDYVARAMRTVGLAGVAPSSIPDEFRRSYASLVAYLSQVKAQRALAAQPTRRPTAGSFGGGGIKLIR